MNFDLIEPGDDLPYEINAIIEIAGQAAPVKYEIDRQYGLLRIDRINRTDMRYPHNYGFVPRTLARDGDPLDIIVLTPVPLAPLSLIACRPVGTLNMTDEAGPDDKIIAVPIDRVCQALTHVLTLTDLGQSTLDALQFFFERQKALEPGRWMRFEGWGDEENAVAVLEAAAMAFVDQTVPKKSHK